MRHWTPALTTMLLITSAAACGGSGEGGDGHVEAGPDAGLASRDSGAEAPDASSPDITEAGTSDADTAGPDAELDSGRPTDSRPDAGAPDAGEPRTEAGAQPEASVPDAEGGGGGVPDAGTPTSVIDSGVPRVDASSGDAGEPGATIPFGAVQWESMNGPPGANHQYFAQDPYHPMEIYLGATRGVYRSTNRGDSWTNVYNGEQSSIAFSRNRAFICSGVPIVLERDGSAHELQEPCTWVFASADDLYISQGTDRTAAEGPLVRLSRSPAGGATFPTTSIGPDDSELPAGLTSVLQDTSSIAVITGVYETSIGLLIRIDVFSAAENKIDSFLMWSDDDGASWSPASLSLDPTLRIFYLAQDPADPSRFIFGTTPRAGIDFAPMRPVSELLFESTDDGQTWGTATSVTERNSLEIRGVAIVDGDYVLTDVDRDVVQLEGPTHDTYVAWPTPSVPNYSTLYELEEVAFDVSDPTRAWGRGRLGWDGVIRTEDSGASWQRTMNGVAAAPAPNLAVHPTDPDVVAACGNLGFLPHITRNAGASWEPMGGTFLMADEIAFDPSDPSHILMVSERSRFAASTDNGASWQDSSPEFTATRIYDFDVSTANGGALYVSNLGSNIARLDGVNSVLSMPEINFTNLLESPDYAYDIDIDPNDPGVLFATYSPKIFEDFGSVWRYDDEQSENDGWSESLRVANSTGVTSVAIDPGDSQMVYAAATGETARLFVSDDGGDSWQRFAEDSGVSFVTVHEVAIDEFDEQHVWAAPWGGGLFESEDGGATWTEVEAPSRSLVTVLARGSELLAADRTAPVIFESGDMGQTWAPIVQLDEDRFVRIMSMARHDEQLYFSALERSTTNPPALTGALFRLGPDGPQEFEVDLPGPVLRFTSHESGLYAVTHISGVFRLQGEDWMDVTGNLPDMGFFDVHVDDLGGLWVAGGSDLARDLTPRIGDPSIVNELYRSDDGGQNWTPVLTDNRFGAPIKRVTSVPGRPELMVVATGNGVFVSDDRGESWTAQEGLDLANLGAIALGPERICVGTLGAGVDCGAFDMAGNVTWEGSNGPFPAIHNLQVEVSPADSDVVYVTSYPGGVFRTVDGGATWLESNFAIPSFDVVDPVLQGYYSLAIDPVTPSTLYLGVYGHGVFRSDNGGATWMPMYADPIVARAGIRRVAVDPTDTNRLYLATEQGVFVSDDAAETWEPLDEGLATRDILSVKVDDTGRAFVGTAGYGMYVHDEAEQRWVHLGVTFGIGEWRVWERRLYQYSSLLFAPDDPSRVYLGHFPSGFFVSEDGGQSWRSQSYGLGNDGMFSLAVRPGEPNVLYAGTYNGIVRSDDHGFTWRQSSSGLPAEQWPFDVVIDESDPRIMYTATKNGQNKGFCDRNQFCGVLMKSIDAGESWFEIMNGMGDDREYYRLIIDPHDHDVLYVSSDKGVFGSADAGDSWWPMNGGLPTTWHRIRDNVARNLWLTADDEHLVLGLVDYGVWRADLSVLSP